MKEKLVRILSITMALMMLLSGCGVPHKEQTAGNTGVTGNDASAVDSKAYRPEEIIQAIASNELEVICNKSNRDYFSLFTSDDEVLQLATRVSQLKDYGTVVETHMYKIDVNSLEAHPQQDAISGAALLYEQLSNYATELNNAYGVCAAVWSSVLCNQTSYYCGKTTEAEEVWAFEQLYDGGQGIFAAYLFKEDQTVKVSVCPFFQCEKSAFNEFSNLDSSDKNGISFTYEERSFDAGTTLSIQSMSEGATIRQDATDRREITERLSKQIGTRANDAYLKLKNVPGEACGVCAQFELFSSMSPTLVIEWDISEMGQELLNNSNQYTSDEMQKAFMEKMNSCVVGNFGGIAQMSASGIMQLKDCIPKDNEKDQLYWMIYGTGNMDDGYLIDAVSFIQNENGCVDIMAYPILRNDFTDEVIHSIQGKQTGTDLAKSLFEVLTDGEAEKTTRLTDWMLNGTVIS